MKKKFTKNRLWQISKFITYFLLSKNVLLFYSIITSITLLFLLNNEKPISFYQDLIDNIINSINIFNININSNFLIQAFIRSTSIIITFISASYTAFSIIILNHFIEFLKKESSKKEE